MGGEHRTGFGGQNEGRRDDVPLLWRRAPQEPFPPGATATCVSKRLCGVLPHLLAGTRLRPGGGGGTNDTWSGLVYVQAENRLGQGQEVVT